MSRERDLIVALLCGRPVVNKRGLSRITYLKDGSAEEKDARRALARMLRTSLPLNAGLRFTLGNLIDPDQELVERRIRFEYRHKGKPSNWLAEKEIAEFIWARVQDGRLTKPVFNQTQEMSGLERSRIRDIWRRWKPILVRRHRIYGPLSEKNISKYWPRRPG